MKKRSDSSSSDKRAVKKTKVQELTQEENIYNKNTYTQFQTRTSIEAFYLHPTESLIAIYSESYTQPGEIGIYTIEGYHVTHSDLLPISHDVRFYGNIGMYFSRNTIVINNLRACITRYSDYGMKSFDFSFSCLDCDKDDNIYVYDHSMSHWHKYQDSEIHVYSPDFEKIRTIDIKGASEINCLKIQEDYLVILSMEPRTRNYKIQRYSFPNVTPLQNMMFEKGFFLYSLKFLAFDPLGNVLISSQEMNKIAVYYLDGKLSYHETEYNPRCDGYFFVVGLAMSKNFQLIRAMNAGVIRIF